MLLWSSLWLTQFTSLFVTVILFVTHSIYFAFCYCYPLCGWLNLLRFLLLWSSLWLTQLSHDDFLCVFVFKNYPAFILNWLLPGTSVRENARAWATNISITSIPHWLLFFALWYPCSERQKTKLVNQKSICFFLHYIVVLHYVIVLKTWTLLIVTIYTHFSLFI